MSTQPVNDDDVAIAAIGQSFSPAEQDWAESHFEALRADQRVEFCNGFATLDGIRLLGLNTAALSGLAREFLSASRWHMYRASIESDPEAQGRRDHLAAKYKLLSNNLQQILNENVN